MIINNSKFFTGDCITSGYIAMPNSNILAMCKANDEYLLIYLLV